jgi:transcription termination factor NusB
MDYIDRAIFLLGYIEYDQLKSPKALVLNEMIELAKRY